MTKRLTTDELILREARFLAQSEIELRLATQNLPPPKDLTKHIDQLIAVNPTFIERARQNVEARNDAYTEALRIIGIDPTNTTAPMLDLEF